MTFLDWQSAHDVRPPWHGGPWGKKWHQSFGLLKDLVADGATQAVRCRWVSVAPDDALAKIGETRGWPQVPGEAAAEYRARLKLNWYLSEWRGTNRGIIAALNAIGLSNVTIREAIDPTWGRNPYGYSDDQKKRHFWVIIDQPHPFGTDFGSLYGGGSVYGGGTVWGVTGDPRLFALIKEIVRRMRSAHAYCQDIIVILSGTIKSAGGADDGDPTGPSDRVAYLGGV